MDAGTRRGRDHTQRVGAGRATWQGKFKQVGPAQPDALYDGANVLYVVAHRIWSQEIPTFPDRQASQGPGTQGWQRKKHEENTRKTLMRVMAR